MLSKKVARNTREIFTEDGTRIIKFHDTNIITVRPDGCTVLNTGGWFTPTTKQRMNQFGFHVIQDRGHWFYLPNGYDGKRIPFVDNRIIIKGGE